MTEQTAPVALVERVRKAIADAGVAIVVVGGCDLPGILRGKRRPASLFAQDPTTVVGFSDYLFAIDIEEQLIPREPSYEGWWPSWDTGLAEIAAVPDLSTFRLAPWLERTAIVLCDYRFPDGRPIEVSPRYVLRRVVDRARSLGLIPKMGPEYEFFLFRENGETLREKGFRNLEPLFSRGSGYGVYRATRDEHIMAPLRENMERFGIPVEGSNPEAGGGQYEIQLVYSELPQAADRAFLYKHAVKEIAAAHGLLATFMAKASPLEFGSSCHLHQSLWSPEGKNLFFDPKAADRFSELSRQYIAGQVATMQEFTLLFAPTINSYKRYRPESAAGTTATWGHENRTTGLRVIRGEDPSGYRVEHRVPGGDVNVYLAMAGALAGGLYGIERGLEAPPPLQGNAYADPSSPPLPGALHESIPAFESSEAAREYLGEEFVRFYAASARWELEQFRANLTDWEVKRYLEYL